jgi:hypothetical protein
MRSKLSVLIAILLLVIQVETVHACTGGGGVIRVTSGTTVMVTPAYDPAAVGDQIYSFSFGVTNFSNRACRFVLSIRRATMPASMTNGTASISYAVERTTGVLIMRTAATPTAGQSTTSVRLVAGASTTINVRARLPASQTTAIRNGIYTDATLTLEVWQSTTAGTPTALRSSSAMSISATRSGTCAISSPTNVTQTIATSAVGLTTGMSTPSPTFLVTCSVISNVVLSSQNGAVTLGNVLETSLTPVGGFRNKIDYSATINAPAGTVTLDTGASVAAPAATPTQVFSNAAEANRLTTVTITPETSTVPLIAGTYEDLLTIRITPQ